MKIKLTILFIALFLLSNFTSQSSAMKVGVGRKAITPQSQFWLNGYAAREKPSTGKSHDLWAKALVIEENPADRIIIVTLDLLGLSREIPEQVAERVIKKYGIRRSQLLINSSHTHSAPVIWPCLSMMFNFSVEDQQIVSKYSHQLTDDIVTVIDMAMSNLVPMEISCGHGSAGFAINRRDTTRFPKPVDHDVPVVKFATPDGRIKAILCGYACHNTTLPATNNLINGDYAGYSMIELEKAYPGATAMFFMGCAGDQNPSPRGTIELAEQHGRTMAAVVEKVLEGGLQQVRPPIRTGFTTVDLEFPPLNLETYQKDILSTDRFIQNRAKLMLEAYNKGWDITKFPYPVQAVRFNRDLTILGMSGEVVVDYSLRAKREYPKENLFVAAYCNEVICYIPSRRILEEGGYEGCTSMIYYGHAGPFAPNVEDKVFSAIYRVMKGVGVKPSKK